MNTLYSIHTFFTGERYRTTKSRYHPTIIVPLLIYSHTKQVSQFIKHTKGTFERMIHSYTVCNTHTTPLHTFIEREHFGKIHFTLWHQTVRSGEQATFNRVAMFVFYHRNRFLFQPFFESWKLLWISELSELSDIQFLIL